MENARSADALNSPSTIVQIPTSQVDSPDSAFLELESLRAALATAKAENEQLLRNSKLRDLQSELFSVQQQNALLRKRRKDPPPSNVPALSVQDLREIPGLNARADAQLQKLGLSDSSSDSDESADDGEGNHNRRPKLSATERTARIEHFATLMYLATQFSWPLVRSLHAAALFEIECGRLRWGDSFSHLEARLLHGPPNQSRSSTATTPIPAVQFCKAYQSGKCSFTKDHFGLIKNERKVLVNKAGCTASLREFCRMSFYRQPATYL